VYRFIGAAVNHGTADGKVLISQDQRVRVDSNFEDSGMLGKISQLGEQQIGLDVGNGVTVQLQRAAVVQVLPKGSIK
jgi:hypothetical protein